MSHSFLLAEKIRQFLDAILLAAGLVKVSLKWPFEGPFSNMLFDQAPNPEMMLYP